MKKRIVSIVLTCMMVLPLATFQVGASSSDARTISVNSLPEKAQLENMLGWLEFYFAFTGDWDSDDHGYDCRTIAQRRGNLFETLIRMPSGAEWYDEWSGKYYYTAVWDIYPGKRSQDLSGTFYNYMSDKSRIDWIMLNILNCSESDLSVLKSRCLNKKDADYGNKVTSYEENGYYYGSSFDIGWEMGWEKINFKLAKYDGTYYYVQFVPYWDWGEGYEPVGEYYATLGLKSIDGKTYWSIFANSSKEFVSFSSVGGFYDVQESDWFASDVQYAVDKKLMKGTSEQYFTPNGNTTRGQAVTILYRLAGSPSVTGSSGFSDVSSGAWYADAVQWASKNGISSGYGNGRFAPNDTLNREQLATMLFRYAQYKDLDTTSSGGLSKFTDSGKVSGYALDAMSWAVSNGLISGTNDGKLNPGSTATRAQLAAILHRFCENVK